MREKTTDDLSQELMSAADLDSYLKDNKDSFLEKELPQLLNELFVQKDISKAELARKAGISEVYLHQVFSGRRKPSRDRLLCICIGLGASLDETQHLLTQGVYAQLYPKARRDSIIIHGLIHQVTLSDINDTLFRENEQALF